MLGTIGRRVAGLLLTLLLASFIIFASLYLAPGDPLSFLSQGHPLTPAELSALRHQYGLDQPFLVRYFQWLGHVLTGNLGVSIVNQQPVASLLGPRAIHTAQLISLSLLITILTGVGLGALAPLRGGHWDTSIVLGTTVGAATPGFVVAIILIAVFGVSLHWLPVSGVGHGLGDSLRHLAMPAVALAATAIAFMARITRTAVQQELRSEHVETARARGLATHAIVRRHVLRNAAIPTVTGAGLVVVVLVAGSVVIEYAFDYDGLGSYVIQAVTTKDFAIVQAITLIYIVVFTFVNLVVDLTCAALDPRIRRAAT